MWKNNLFILTSIFAITLQPCFAAEVSNEFLFATKKLILAMFGVIISVVLIFVLLSLYNKFFHNPKVNEKTTYDENELAPAKDIDNAISNFLNRTDV